jgi:hypothetical protein
LVSKRSFFGSKASLAFFASSAMIWAQSSSRFLSPSRALSASPALSPLSSPLFSSPSFSSPLPASLFSLLSASLSFWASSLPPLLSSAPSPFPPSSPLPASPFFLRLWLCCSPSWSSVPALSWAPNAAA